MKNKSLRIGFLALALIGLAGCNGGHNATASSSVQTMQQSEGSSHAANSHKTPAQTVKDSADDIAWKNKVWDRAFIVQSLAVIDPETSLSKEGMVLSFPHGKTMYSQYQEGVNPDSMTLSLRNDSYEPKLSSDEKIVSVKPCYSYMQGYEEFYPEKYDWVNVSLTNKNRVFMNWSRNDDGIYAWEMVGRTHAQNGSDVKLNDIACYIEPNRETEPDDGDQHAILAAVGGKTNDKDISAYAELGYVDLSGEVKDASWKILPDHSDDGHPDGEKLSMALNAVAIGNVADPGSGSIEPVFAAAGDNGIIFKRVATVENVSTYYIVQDRVIDEENTNLNYNAISYIPTNHKFLVGGDFYLGLVNMSSGIRSSNDLINVPVLLGSSSHYVPNLLNYSEKIGHVGVTSIACVASYCAAVVKSYADKDYTEIHTSSFMFKMNDGASIPNAERSKEYDDIKVGSDFVPGELNPQIYGDPWGNSFYLLTSTGSKSEIYKYTYGDGSNFKLFVNSMPNLSRSR